jgi:hypothetical protein
MTSQPQGFPLTSRDSTGGNLAVGDEVVIRSVNSCIKDLPEEDQNRLLAMDVFRCVLMGGEQVANTDFARPMQEKIKPGRDLHTSRPSRWKQRTKPVMLNREFTELSSPWRSRA